MNTDLFEILKELGVLSLVHRLFVTEKPRGGR